MGNTLGIMQQLGAVTQPEDAEEASPTKWLIPPTSWYMNTRKLALDLR
jgi:hypothetical protein